MLTYWTAPVISKTDETIRGIINTMMTQALLVQWWLVGRRSQNKNHGKHKHVSFSLHPKYPTDMLLMSSSQSSR